ncbi:MAG: hypothetical protein L3J57_14615 [Desulfuromusa sp.]|nr:hypothetical protein [Desulfuromusa sp.]
MEWKLEMVNSLKEAKHGEAAAIITTYAELTGKSASALYKIAKRAGYIAGRKKRTDKGELKSCLNKYQLNFISTLMQETARQVKGVIMPVSKALDIAIDNGVIQKGQISVSRLQSILNERDMHKAALDADTPSIRMRSLHPNHVHIFDASICIQYYLKKGKGLALLDERDFREKKPQNFAKIKLRIIRMVLVDHYSGTLFVKYYEALGESKAITYDFLCSAWRGQGLEKFPFRGVPSYLLMDAGSANIAKSILALLEALEIEIPKNMPHNPRRQGSAEVAQNIVECQFESALGLEAAYSIEELNIWCQDWLVEFNSLRIHSRHKMPRTQCWLEIKQEELRELPPANIMHELYSEPVVERTVRQDNTITFLADEYQLKHIPGIRPKLKVSVRRRPYLLPEIAIIFNEEEFLVKPLTILAGGFREDAAVIGEEYKAQPETSIQKVRKVNENLAYGEEKKKGALPFGGTLQVHGHRADKVTTIPIPKRSTPMEISRGTVIQQISMMAFIKRIKEEVGRVEPATNHTLRDEFGSSIDIERADQVIAAMLAGRDWHEVDGEDRQAL